MGRTRVDCYDDAAGYQSPDVGLCDCGRKTALLREALEAMLNLAPRIKNERGGCFGDGGQDCVCTACKIRREIGLTCNGRV